jgi:ATP-dependent DNA helicase RecQ
VSLPAPGISPRDLLGRFGHTGFRPGQLAAIERLLAGRSVLTIFPTGGGKSLCFQLPSLLLDGLTLVISPLIALMKDQVDALNAAGLAAARLDSTLAKAEVFDVFDRLSDGRLKLLYVAPERLGNERFLARLGRRPISLLAIDEAHCISEWGHNFRPDYLKLEALARELRVERVLALTATATPAVAADIRRAFAIAPDDEVRTDFHRPNLQLNALRTSAEARPGLLIERLRATPGGSTIVYVTLQRTAEEVAERLSAEGLSARAYHAGMEDEARHAVQDAFMAGRCEVVVATIAFGMGIDKADIRRVIHYNLPKTLENYVQEIGRAGRDGAASVCELLAVASDQVVLSNFSYGDTPAPSAVRALVEHLLSRGERFSVSTTTLSQEHDIRPLVCSTALTYLELDGILRATGPFYAGYKVKLLGSEEELFRGLDERRRGFVQQVLASGQKGRAWITLDVAKAAQAASAERERVVKALDWLEEQGRVELAVDGLRLGFQRLREADPDAVADSLVQRFQRREQADIDRLARVLGYVEEPGCRTRQLLAYFGEELPGDCGHCSACQGLAEGPPSEGAAPLELGETARGLVRTLLAEDHAALREPRALTRFLCGLSSPAATRARLGRHASFGALDRQPFAAVLGLVEDVLTRT